MSVFSFMWIIREKSDSIQKTHLLISLSTIISPTDALFLPNIQCFSNRRPLISFPSNIFWIRRVVFQKTRCFYNRRPPISFSSSIYWIGGLRFHFHPVFFESDVLFLRKLDVFQIGGLRFDFHRVFIKSDALARNAKSLLNPLLRISTTKAR